MIVLAFSLLAILIGAADLVPDTWGEIATVVGLSTGGVTLLWKVFGIASAVKMTEMIVRRELLPNNGSSLVDRMERVEHYTCSEAITCPLRPPRAGELPRRDQRPPHLEASDD